MGIVESQTGRIGNLSDGHGTVTVSGEGSQWNNDYSIYVGDEGQGTLNIFDQGHGIQYDWIYFIARRIEWNRSGPRCPDPCGKIPAI